MINQLKIQFFKAFKNYEINFKNIQLIIGGNNSGKTSIFNALQIFFCCVEKTLEFTSQSNVTLKKTQLPEIGAIPYFNAKDLFYLQKTRSGI